jgi:hypothetical protein
MKILQEKYPIGSIKGQKTAGRYIDGILYSNLQILAKSIVNDMTFLALISSSTLEVGSGKSTHAQQIGEAYQNSVNEQHGLDLKFTMKNIVFNAEQLIKRAFELPKYSCLILDEGDDLDSHYYSQLAHTLRKFFRKCRQLNLFIIVILPNFFQIPAPYAISRSVFFIDVRFEGEFERGYFYFYSFGKKKDLYIQGKKTQNYSVVKADFSGRFTDGYAVPENEYRRAKYQDMLDDKDEKKSYTLDEATKHLFLLSHSRVPEFSVTKLSELFGIGKTTGYDWINEENAHKTS